MVWWVPERGTISLRVGLGVDVLVAREISSGEIKEYRGARRSLERLKEIEGDQRGSKRSERIKEIGGDQGDQGDRSLIEGRRALSNGHSAGGTTHPVV